MKYGLFMHLLFSYLVIPLKLLLKKYDWLLQ